MAVELRSVGVSPGADSTTCVIVKPVGLTVGDLMIAHIYFKAIDATVTPTANWTEIRQVTHETDNETAALFWKIADGDDVAADDFTFTSDDEVNFGAITAWTGHDPAAPINAESGQYNTYSGAGTVTAPSITPSVANCVILMFGSTGNDYTYTDYAIVDDDPEGWDEAYDLQYKGTTDCSMAMGYVTRPETTATGLGTCDMSAGDPSIGFLVAIAPAAEPPPEEERHQTPHCRPKKLRTEWLSTMGM